MADNILTEPIKEALKKLFHEEFLTLKDFTDKATELTGLHCRLNKNHTRFYVGDMVFEINLEREEGDRKILTGPHQYYKYWVLRGALRRLK